jgi:phosphatidylserine/phosphatidylglycerophosphate/cardiolipin synthase-like enzyme
MHCKFIVVDGVTLETSSFNFTASADNKNAENVLVIHDGTVAYRFGREWERMWRSRKARCRGINR